MPVSHVWICVHPWEIRGYHGRCMGGKLYDMGGDSFFLGKHRFFSDLNEIVVWRFLLMQRVRFVIVLFPVDNFVDESSRRPVSRVLSLRRRKGQPFLCDARYRAPDATNPGSRAGMPPAAALSRPACRPYSVLLPVGFTLPPLLPGARCALAAPFHPCLAHGFPCGRGGLFSVALSLGSPPPAVSRHRIPVEPGLSSSRRCRQPAAARPSGDARGGPCRGTGQPGGLVLRADRVMVRAC
jgi:hypothetical protein